MKQTILLSVITGLLTAPVSLGSVPGPNGDLDEILAKMQTASRKIRTVQAYLHQEVRDPQIGGKPATSGGQMMFEHRAGGDDRVRINYDKPAGQVICIAGDDIILYQAAIKQATITHRRALAQKNQEFDFIATPYASVASLKSRYDIVHVGDEQVNGAPASKLELTPKKQSSVRKLALWVDQSSWLPIKYQVVEVNQTITTFTLSNVFTNRNLAPDTFKVKLPSGTAIVRP